MTMTRPAVPGPRTPDSTSIPPLPRPDRWHRPLLAVAALMAVLTLVCVVLVLADPREILGQNGWFKPLKFAISIGIYCVSLAWLIGQLGRHRRLGQVAGTLTAGALLVEIVIIAGAVALGTTSHFNVATALNTTFWATMAASIVAAWVMALPIGLALLSNPGPDRARNLAIRAGLLLTLIGMGLGFLMTGPTAEQLNDFQGVAGAHTVGVADGGPGLPFLGWSVVGGDLRVPHFVGLHALQVIPLALLAIELLSRRVALLRDARTRARLVVVVAGTYLATMAVLTWQALLGQSIIAPAGPVLLAGVAIPVVAVASVVAVLVLGRRAEQAGPTR